MSPLAGAQITDEVSIIDVNASLLGIVGQHGEVKDVTGVEVQALGQLARADLGALEVHQDRNRM
jgi:hypothetical protein